MFPLLSSRADSLMRRRTETLHLRECDYNRAYRFVILVKYGVCLCGNEGCSCISRSSILVAVFPDPWTGESRGLAMFFRSGVQPSSEDLLVNSRFHSVVGPDSRYA
jgi:hypothetical protein